MPGKIVMPGTLKKPYAVRKGYALPGSTSASVPRGRNAAVVRGQERFRVERRKRIANRSAYGIVGITESPDGTMKELLARPSILGSFRNTVFTGTTGAFLNPGTYL